MLKIVFMGSPQFAVPTLEALIAEPQIEVCAVVTQPDKPAGRGRQLVEPPVKVCANTHHIHCYQPEKLKTDEFRNWFTEQNPDLVLVAAYGKILPDYVVNGPKYGAINVHGSLLPYYRGAAPIERAIMDGKEEIGVTIMKMDEGLDTGDMLAKAKISSEGLTGGEAEEKLAELGGSLLVEYLRNPEKYPPEKQDMSINSYASKITEEDRSIDFNQSPVDIYNRIRALVPSAPAIVRLNDQSVKILESRVSGEKPSGKPGTINVLNAKGTGYIRVNCKDGTLDILSLVPPGKNRMSSGDFIRGRKISETECITN